VTQEKHTYEVRPRKDHRGVDLISDALPFGRLWYGEPNAISAIDYAKFRSRSHQAVIRVYDEAGNIIGTHEQTEPFRGPVSIRAGAPPSRLVETLSLDVAKVSEKLTFSICHVKTSG
jgi:hypothetical protein